jgi:TrmH family RNA methyltransferase
MISQNKIKLINSLAKKKYRDSNQLFIAEGEKLVSDLIHSSIKIKCIFACKEWIEEHHFSQHEKNNIEIRETDFRYLKKITQLKTASPVIAICEITNKALSAISFANSLCIALDGIQDPGNLGTIIRLADWFGIKNIVCSKTTVDVYNPKVVQATMGAIARVNVYYTDLENFISQQVKTGIPVYGTFLDGQNIYSKTLSNHGIIVMGNEGNGISNGIKDFVTEKLLIPNFANSDDYSESLNVSTATAITLSEFRRRF